MSSSSANRREFLHTLAVGAAAGLMPTSPTVARPPGSNGDFLLAKGLTYLNTGTIGPTRRATLEAVRRAWELLESNPIAHYGLLAGAPLLDDTRTLAAAFLGCDVDEMAVTGSTTSGMNAIASGMRLGPGDRVLITDQEHDGGAHCWHYLARERGVGLDVVTIPRDEHRASALVQRVAAALRPDTRVLSVSHVFSSTGLRMPIADLAAVARARGVLCVVDGAQAAGAIQVNVRALGCHAYATSGHKWLLGPKGTGLLYVEKDAQEVIRPIAFDGGFRTYSPDNGVVDLPAILGLGTAIRHLASANITRVEAWNLQLRERLAERLAMVPGLALVSPPMGPLASPLLTALLPERINNAEFTLALRDRHRVQIRPTHAVFGFNGIRFSVHEFNTEADVDRAADAVRRELAA